MPESAPAVQTFETLSLKDALVLIAFPTTGSAAPIAAQYLVRHLNLPLVGHLRLPDLAGLVSIQDGIVTSPVRIYGGEVACKIGHDCPRIFVVTTELALPPPVLGRIGDALLTWAGKGGAHLMLALEGVVRQEGDDTPDVYCASAEQEILKILQKTKVEVMERAVIAGIAAQILLDGGKHGIHTGALLVEASRDHPDGRAAAALIEVVSRMIPDVPVDAKPLELEAKALEEELKRSRGNAPPLPSVPPGESFI